MKRLPLFLLLLVLSFNLVSAATLKGTVYNTNLDPESNVLIKMNTIPEQRILSRDGNYAFTIAPGTYTITAQKGAISTTEDIPIPNEGSYIFDLFLFPEGTEEEDLWNETEQNLVEDSGSTDRSWWFIVMGIVIIIIIVVVYLQLKKKKHRKKEELSKESEKNISRSEESKTEDIDERLASDSGMLEKMVEIIKNHDGRITQKELRKEMMYLSEAKISLLLTELEHKGKIEKIKKGRGNVVIVK